MTRMKIFVKTKPNAKREKIVKIDATHFAAFVTAPPEKGKANQAVIKLLAEHFRLPLSRIRIISGAASRNKIIEI